MIALPHDTEAIADDIGSLQSPRRPVCARQPMRWHLKPVALSLQAHIAIIGALIWLSSLSNPPAQPPGRSVVKAINARLYSAPFRPTPAPAKSGAVSQTSVLPTTVQPVVTPRSTASDTAANAQPPQPDSSALPVQVAPLPNTPDLDHAEPLNTDRISAPEHTPAVKTPASTSANTIGGSVRQATASYFSAVRAQQQDQLAAGAARQFQQGKTTRTLQDTRTITQIQALPDPAAPVTVNCAGKVNQSLAFVSMLSGGNLKCSEPTKHLQQTIDKRVQQHTVKR
ncbi:hypothetical protein IT774_15385 [Salinimonas marina]|uniref:Uncharacterized protein n=1 Tax=Salinimonas marina TaxID=2785918 RepID=A0A7S9DWV0_9ALTE|nr:hypothetical protein [Salinimonas marina]QPG05457.1 hypothetical protein IT774_15385 [Salinimonas marina]